VGTAVAALTLAGAVACAGKSNSVQIVQQGDGASAGPGGNSAFLDCLRSNGVTLPSGRPSGFPRPSGSRRSPFPRPSGNPSMRPSRSPRMLPSDIPSVCASLRPTGRRSG
jgi:hypothetical protein